MADGTGIPTGRVGSCHILLSPQHVFVEGFFYGVISQEPGWVAPTFTDPWITPMVTQLLPLQGWFLGVPRLAEDCRLVTDKFA